jgi:pimeloyl-ACP methyl ester carboxylesterase
MRINDSIGLPLRVRAEQALAMSRVARLMRFDVRGASPACAAETRDLVVLVHGLLATPGVFRPLRYRLSALRALEVWTLAYAPGAGVEASTSELLRRLSAVPESITLHLVGHSQGGLIVRCAAARLAAERVAQTISLATPFGGAEGAHLLPWGWGSELAAESPLLQKLTAGVDGFRAVAPHLSIVGGYDRTARDAPLRGGGPYERVVIEDAGHNGLLLSPHVQDLVAARIRKSRSSG